MEQLSFCIVMGNTAELFSIHRISRLKGQIGCLHAGKSFVESQRMGSRYHIPLNLTNSKHVINSLKLSHRSQINAFEFH